MLVHRVMRKTHFERLESETSGALKTMQDIQHIQSGSDQSSLSQVEKQCLVEAHQRMRKSVGLLVMAGAKLQSHQYWLRAYFLKYMNYANSKEASLKRQLKHLDIQIPEQSEKVNLVFSYLHKKISNENGAAVLAFIYVTEYCMNKICMSHMRSAVGFEDDMHRKYVFSSNGDIDNETIEMLPEIIDLLCEDDLEFLIETSQTLFRLCQVTHNIIE